MNFPDLRHFEKLRRDLWASPSGSRAAVFVGAGFSLNARRRPGVSAGFPTWRQLGGDLYDELYPVGDGTEHKMPQVQREIATAGYGVLRLASEYAAAFGEQRLYECIRSKIPDEQFVPSELHELLLELPWADVFTTNYDTLLERTRTQRTLYQVVTKPEDLLASAKPRIIKLHGSFPNQIPYILTEEHFRQYPRRSAPFVNTVQQCLMENTLVLIGFSGDDPNFLEWTGWVRDALGEHHPSIYLCGLLDLTSPQRKLLADRKVIPIDLTPVFNGRLKQVSHDDALKWLLLSLHQGRPTMPHLWPNNEREKPKAEDLPDIIGPPTVSLSESKVWPQPPLNPGVFFKVYKWWVTERRTYPGWQVAPMDVRERVWNDTQIWIFSVIKFASAKDLGTADSLLLLWELNWRLELCLAPLFQDWIEVIEKRLEEALLQGISNLQPSSEASLMHRQPPNFFSICHDLSLAIAREAREMFDAERHSLWLGRVKKFSDENSISQSSWRYEDALYSMWNMDFMGVRSKVGEWRSANVSDPRDDLRQAALLGEIGDVQKAAELANNGLNTIRDAIRHNRHDLGLLSAEGWALKCHTAISQTDFKMFGPPNDVRERWQELNSFLCNPWQVFYELKAAVRSVPIEVRALDHVIEHTGFDIGAKRKSYNYRSDNLGELIPSYALIRLFEVAAIPMHLPGVNIVDEKILWACEHIQSGIAFWTGVIAFRACPKFDALNETCWTRKRIAELSNAQVDKLFDWVMTRVEQTKMALPAHPVTHDLSSAFLPFFIELLSRLCFRVNDQRLTAALELALSVHEVPLIREHISLHDCCTPLFRRLYAAASDSLAVSWLPKLISFPIVRIKHPKNFPIDNFWPDPITDYPASNVKGEIIDSTRSEISTMTSRLLGIARCEQGTERTRALERLFVIEGAGLLDEKNSEDLAESFWGRSAADELPESNRWKLHSYFAMPIPPGRDVDKIVRKKILQMVPWKSVGSELQTDGSQRRQYHYFGGTNRLIQESALATLALVNLPDERAGKIEWEADEIEQLLTKVIGWWDADSVVLRQDNDAGQMFRDAIHEAASDIPKFLNRVIFPNYTKIADNSKVAIGRLLTELHDSGISVVETLPFQVLAKCVTHESIAADTAAALASNSEAQASMAGKAIYIWAALSKNGRVEELPAHLAFSLVVHVISGWDPGLDDKIFWLQQLIQNQPEAVSEDMLKMLLPWIGKMEPDTRTSPPCTTSRKWNDSERALYRRRFAALAHSLHAFHVSKDLPVDQSLTEWSRACQNDMSPEIRKAWA